MWKDGKKWVYSITYDEGCQALIEHALSVHRRYNISGHVALVANEIGVPRKVKGSSYEGWMILNRDELHMLASEGWGMSCHGMSHTRITEENLEPELFESRIKLVKASGMSVRIFCLPGNNEHFEIVYANAARAGYVANMTIYDDVNPPDVDLMRLCRVPLHTQYPPPFYSAFDPYKRIHQAIDMGGWIIDYCHCPMPGKAVHPWKDCTLEQLEERFETVQRVGGDDVWLAEPGKVIKYILGKTGGNKNGQKGKIRS